MSSAINASGSSRHGPRALPALLVICALALLQACASDSHTARGATRGAGTGAVSGAVGGLVGSLVFGGDVGGSMARGAVVGAAVGGTAGAISGDARDRREAETHQAERDTLRDEIGPEAYDGLTALAECRHEASLRQAAKAQQSKNPNYALAGLWLEVLSYADRRDEARARSLFPRIVDQDWDIETEAQAEEAMRDALNELMGIREEYGLPRVC